MNINLFTNNSEDNAINKALTSLASLTGTLKDTTDILNPVLILSDIDNYIGVCNYVQIEELNRYYFVVDIKSLHNNLWEVTLHVDVLMSFKDDILKQYAIIERQEHNVNMELSDNIINTEQETYIQYLKFPNEFDEFQICIPILGN